MTNESNALMIKVQQALKNAGKQIEKSEKKLIKGDMASLQKCISKFRVDKVTQAELDNMKQAKEHLENSSTHLLSQWT